MDLTDTERLTLSRIQRKVERAGGIENLVDSDILIELKRGIEQGKFEEGTFYRVMDIEELRTVAKTRHLLNIYKFVNRDKEINAESCGYEGLVQVEIEGRAVPYNAGEEEMLLYSARRLKLIRVFRNQVYLVLEQ